MKKKNISKYALQVYHLTSNVNIDHINEIFGEYGEVNHVDLPIDPINFKHRGFATVHFKNKEDAKKAQLYLDES